MVLALCNNYLSSVSRKALYKQYSKNCRLARGMSGNQAGGYSWDKWEGQQKVVSPSAGELRVCILQKLAPSVVLTLV